MRRPVVSASGKRDGRINHRNSRALSRAAGVFVETLEDRRLLSVSVSNGVLDIVGTSAANKITVQYGGSGTSSIRIKGPGFAQSVPSAGITKIVINGEGGGDSITLSDVHGVLAIPARIKGGPGDESIVGSSSGYDSLVGGNGDDYIQASGSGNIVRGGSGAADTLVGGSSDEILNGPGENLISTNDGASFTVSTNSPPKAIALSSADAGETSFQPLVDGIINPTVVGYTPEQVRTAYGLGLLNQPTVTNLGQGQTIEIVDAYDSTSVFNDLTVFSQEFGLPVPTAQNFEKVFAAGTQPVTNDSWDVEIDLDVEWAHVIAPDAKIVLVEANTNSNADLYNAVAVAGDLAANSPSGGGVVSMSFGGTEDAIATDPVDGPEEYTMDNIFAEYPTVSFIAASGDTGGEASYPAMSPYVTSVGGTTMELNADGAITGTTTAWADSGGGVSVNEPQPVYQQILGTPGVLANGAAARVGPDVAMLANPSTGVALYDTTPNPDGDSGWQEEGGTSLACPMFAAVVALANQSRIANGQPVIGGNLNDAIYNFNLNFPGRDFSLGGVVGYSDTAAPVGYVGFGQPVVPNFISDLGNLGVNGQTPPQYSINVNTSQILSVTTLYGDLNAPVSGSTQITDSYGGEGLSSGTAISTGPTTFVLTLNETDQNQVSISYTVTCTVNDLATGAFTGFLAGTDGGLFTNPTLGVGQTIGIYFEGNVTPHSNGTSDISGDFYGAIENADGTFTEIGQNGVGGSGDGTVMGSFNS